MSTHRPHNFRWKFADPADAEVIYTDQIADNTTRGLKYMPIEEPTYEYACLHLLDGNGSGPDMPPIDTANPKPWSYGYLLKLPEILNQFAADGWRVIEVFLYETPTLTSVAGYSPGPIREGRVVLERRVRR